MKYKYPKLWNTLTFKKLDEYSVEVTDYLCDETYVVKPEEAEFMRKLDGKTNPHHIETTLTQDEIDYLIEALDGYELLKWSNVYEVDGTVVRTLWEPNWTIPLRVLAFFWNNILLISWLPILILGICMFQMNFMSAELDMIWIGNIVGIVAGMFFHEFGHAFAGASYGARVAEMGLLRMCYIIPGACVVMDTTPVKSRLKRVQISAAGVETNFLLAGVFLIVGSVFGRLGGLCLAAAIQNVFLGAINLTLIKGLDGMAIAGELLGIEEVVEKAKEIICSYKLKRKLKSYGMPGRITIAACYMVCIFQVAMPLLILLNVLEVVICFV